MPDDEEAIHLNFGATRKELYGFLMLVVGGLWYVLTTCSVAC